MSANEYKGLGSLSHLVTEQLRQNERTKHLKEGEYFKTHTFQDRKDKTHDVDYKAVPDYKNNVNLSIKPNDPMLKDKLENTVDTLHNKKEIDNTEENKTSPKGLDFYTNGHNASDKENNNKETSNSNVNMGVYSEEWYAQLNRYMDPTNRDGIKDIVEAYKNRK